MDTRMDESDNESPSAQGAEMMDFTRKPLTRASIVHLTFLAQVSVV
jgi:hypothetical protein